LYALPWDLDDDPELFTSMSQLNATFHTIAPTTFSKIAHIEGIEEQETLPPPSAPTK
jgi:hypothetical protein